jgi:hypothetical protein
MKEKLTQADLEYACSNNVQSACVQAGARRLGDLVLRMAREIVERREAERISVDVPTERAAHPREEFLSTFRVAHTTLHQLWTAAVGKEGYDKAAWRTLDNALARFARNAAVSVGIARTEPLL